MEIRPLTAPSAGHRTGAEVCGITLSNPLPGG